MDDPGKLNEQGELDTNLDWEHLEIASIACWRCNLEFGGQHQQCPHCLAWRKDLQETQGESSGSSGGNPGRGRTRTATPAALKKTLTAYCILLATSVAMGGFLHAHLAITGKPVSDALQLICVGSVELIDTIVVISAVWLIGKRDRLHRPTLSRSIAWIVGLLSIPALLLVNIAYHQLLQNVLATDPPEPSILDSINVASLLFVCIQPALIEEIFFRYLALSALSETVGRHTAIWLTAMMFSLLHVGAMLSMPYLFLLGAALGYARTYSAGMTLTILIHFFHNLAVLWIGGAA